MGTIQYQLDNKRNAPLGRPLNIQVTRGNDWMERNPKTMKLPIVTGPLRPKPYPTHSGGKNSEDGKGNYTPTSQYTLPPQEKGKRQGKMADINEEERPPHIVPKRHQPYQRTKTHYLTQIPSNMQYARMSKINETIENKGGDILSSECPLRQMAEPLKPT